MMSLTYVTKKLEDQTLEEGELGSQKECQVEDSGTESDDETDKEEGDDIESEEGDLNLDSGVSLNLRSGADRAHRGRSRQLPTLTRLGSCAGQSSLPKPHNIQRPCLDFEKMQQIKTKVVTSWRQGTELSLFCW